MNKALITLLLLCPFTLVLAQTKPKAKAAATPVSADTKASITRGEAVYKQYCLVCHQADGGGVPNMNPPLINTTWITGDKKRIIKAVLNGFPTSVDIDGQSYSNNMPPHNFLKDQEIADVLTYVRASFNNKSSAVKVAEVKLARAAKK